MILGPGLISLCRGAGGDEICLSTVDSAEFIPSLIACMSLCLPNPFIPELKCRESFRPETTGGSEKKRTFIFEEQTLLSMGCRSIS